MPVLRLGRFAASAIILTLLLSVHARAAEQADPIQASGDKEVWDRHHNKVELFGNAIVRKAAESLQADYIILDQVAHTLDARGDCIYITVDTVIYGDEMHFNLETRTGTVVNGRVSTDRFTLGGQRINKLGENHFQTHWGEYSTCRDCPQSWSFLARDVDLTVEGYAFMDDVRLKIDDASTLWMPYMILPIKSKRQTGFLFPRYMLSSQDGFVFVEPFFWAINRSSDMTIGLGEYSDRGVRFEWEGRYALSPRSQGRANFNYVHDKTLGTATGDGLYNPSQNQKRFNVDVQQTQELPWHLEEKLRVMEASDNFYPFRFADFSGLAQDAYLPSSFNINYSGSLLSANLGIRNYRNLLFLGNDMRTFDPATVQETPKFDVTTNDRELFGTGFYGGLSLGMTNFTRASAGYDSAYQIENAINSVQFGPVAAFPPFHPGVDPLRKATRFSLTPTLYTTVEPIEGVSLIPSARYNSYYYFFRDVSGVAPLYQAYPVFQLDLVTQFQRIYDMDNPDVPRRKHLIRPILTYSNIPAIQRDETHPFIQQMKFASTGLPNGASFVGFNFDDLDIVPRDNSPNATNYYIPLGNSVTFGFLTQLIDRLGALEQESASYRVPLELSATQTFSFREYQVQENPGSPQPFSRLEANMKTNYIDKFTTDSTYHYYPYEVGIHQEFLSSAGYVFERGYHQRILNFDRSISLGYTWSQLGYTGGGASASNVGTHQVSAAVNFSLSDYLLPTAAASYNIVTHTLSSWSYSLSFASPSQCWRVVTGFSFDPTMGHVFSAPTFSLNLTGNGFEGMNDFSH